MQHLHAAKPGAQLSKAEFTAAVDAFARAGWPKGRGRLRGVRLVDRMKADTLVPVADRRTGRVYKAYKGDSNAFMDLLRLPDGRWKGWIVSTFVANQRAAAQPSWKAEYPAAKRIARLFNGDMARLERDGVETLVTIVKMSGQTVVMSEHTAAGPLKSRDESKDDPYRYVSMAASRLRDARFRPVTVTVDGRVIDPGPLSEPK